jgi:cation:H+ antiporter
LLQQTEIGRATGIGMLATLILYFTAIYVFERKRQNSVFANEAREIEDIPLSATLAVAATAIGLVLLVAGARFLVDGAIGIARDLDVSEAAIGLTVVAVGTSLPELATVIVAALRRHPDVVLANVIGSNTFNILATLGATATISPIPIAERFGTLDGPIMLGVSLVAALMLLTMRTIGRWLGLLLLTAYAAYLSLQVLLGVI